MKFSGNSEKFPTFRRAKMNTIQILCRVLWTMSFLPGYVGPTYPLFPAAAPYPNPVFIPAMPGKTPKCAKDPRLTFCVDPDYYPKERIIYLLENNMYDLGTLLQDETRDTYTFEARDGGVMPTTMTYGKTPSQPGKGYPQPKPPSHYLPPPPRNNTYYGQRRPSKFGAPQFLKPPDPSDSPYSTNLYYSSNTTPSLNSFTSSYPNKHDSSHFSNSRSTPDHEASGPYPRYPKNKFRTTAAPYESPGPQQKWWRKILRREKRQTNLSEDLCPAQSSYIMPRAAQSVVGDWMFVVNVDERYTQLVKSETCIRNTCEGSCDVPDGFSAVCQQQYVQKRLVALDGSGSKLNSDTFWFPSCCICKVRPTAG